MNFVPYNNNDEIKEMDKSHFKKNTNKYKIFNKEKNNKFINNIDKDTLKEGNEDKNPTELEFIKSDSNFNIIPNNSFNLKKGKHRPQDQKNSKKSLPIYQHVPWYSFQPKFKEKLLKTTSLLPKSKSESNIISNESLKPESWEIILPESSTHVQMEEDQNQNQKIKDFKKLSIHSSNFSTLLSSDSSSCSSSSNKKSDPDILKSLLFSTLKTRENKFCYQISHHKYPSNDPNELNNKNNSISDHEFTKNRDKNITYNIYNKRDKELNEINNNDYENYKNYLETQYFLYNENDDFNNDNDSNIIYNKYNEINNDDAINYNDYKDDNYEKYKMYLESQYFFNGNNNDEDKNDTMDTENKNKKHSCIFQDLIYDESKSSFYSSSGLSLISSSSSFSSSSSSKSYPYMKVKKSSYSMSNGEYDPAKNKVFNPTINNYESFSNENLTAPSKNHTDKSKKVINQKGNENLSNKDPDNKNDNDTLKVLDPFRPTNNDNNDDDLCICSQHGSCQCSPDCYCKKKKILVNETQEIMKKD